MSIEACCVSKEALVRTLPVCQPRKHAGSFQNDGPFWAGGGGGPGTLKALNLRLRIAEPQGP